MSVDYVYTIMYNFIQYNASDAAQQSHLPCHRGNATTSLRFPTPDR